MIYKESNILQSLMFGGNNRDKQEESAWMKNHAEYDTPEQAYDRAQMMNRIYNEPMAVVSRGDKYHSVPLQLAKQHKTRAIHKISSIAKQALTIGRSGDMVPHMLRGQNAPKIGDDDIEPHTLIPKKHIKTAETSKANDFLPDVKPKPEVEGILGTSVHINPTKNVGYQWTKDVFPLMLGGLALGAGVGSLMKGNKGLKWAEKIRAGLKPVTEAGEQVVKMGPVESKIDDLLSKINPRTANALHGGALGMFFGSLAGNMKHYDYLNALYRNYQEGDKKK